MNKDELIIKLKDLRRFATEEKPAACVYEAINTLIHVCEFLLNSYQPERTSEEARKGCDVPNTPTKGSETNRND